MLMFTWDQKIARAQKLSTGDSSAKDVLAIYIKVAGFQKQISQGLNGAEHFDVRSLLRFLPQLHTLVKQLNSAPLEKAAAELGEQQNPWSELLLQHWEQDSEMSSPAKSFLAYTLLQPYAE